MVGYMKMKIFLEALALILLLMIKGCSTGTATEETESRLLDYTFEIKDTKAIDDILSNQKFIYSTNTDRKYIAVITNKLDIASLKQYPVEKDGTVDLTIPKGSNFVLSLPANKTIAYTWNIKSEDNEGNIRFDSRAWIEVDSSKPPKNSVGIDYSRQNFHFRALKEGNTKLVMRYEHQTEESNEYFEVTINIKIK
jgi:predicted secreted protein